MLERHGVQVVFGCETTAQKVCDGQFDEVVIATGSAALPIDLSDVQSMLTMEQALAEPDRLGPKVAFCDITGEWSALSVIEYLADLGKKVTVFTPVAGFAWRTTIYSTLSSRKRLREKGVRLALLRSVKFFDGEVLRVEDTSTGEVLDEVGFTSLVGAQYGVPRSQLEADLKALAGRGVHLPRWRLVGDCLSARTAVEAVYEGHALGRAL
jgi:hypothetical protein